MDASPPWEQRGQDLTRTPCSPWGEALEQELCGGAEPEVLKPDVGSLSRGASEGGHAQQGGGRAWERVCERTLGCAGLRGTCGHGTGE